MTKRATRDNSSSVGLFPFLAVLLCTMGALLVLLVVLAQRVGEQVADQRQQAPPTDTGTRADLAAMTELARQLDEVRQYQQKLQQLREQGEACLREQQLRLSHLEEHTRRLEHELAQLSLAAQQLEATEQNQSVDREQAEREAERLRQLIADTEKQLEELRDQNSGERSFAIVPYKGRNGTHRKPVYIECTAEGIILQPEGFRFEPSDFAAPSWPGNPLAAALRATREHLIAQAARAGEPEPLDPYPLILVRPEGITQYLVARRAITSWDSDYGYEFIDADWKLDFPDLPDPQLAQAQQHAVMIARERLARLAQAAPRRFRGIGAGNGRGGGTGDSRGTGQGIGRYGEGASTRTGEGSSATGNGSTAGTKTEPAGESAAGEFASTDGDYQFGALNGDPSQGGQGADSHAGDPGGQSTDVAGEMTGNTTDGAAMGAQSGQSGSPGGAARQASAQAGSGAEGPNSKSSSGGMSGQDNPEPTDPAAADSGVGWTMQLRRKMDAANLSGVNNQSARGSVPIRRSISVVVRQDRLVLLPSSHADKGVGATATLIMLGQSRDRIVDEFVAALRSRIDEWGLAGNGLYWRPVLNLHVGPEAQQTAQQLTRLLEGSGVDVQLAETARASQGERTDATR